MCLLTDESKRHIKKKWNRVTSSIWTKLFSAIFTIQFGLVVFFQSRVLVRNYSIYNDDRFKEAYKCDKDEDNSVEYLFAFSAIQSLVFMVLQLYLVYFGLNAIFHEHIIQIITLVALNFGSAAYSLVQLLQIKIRVDRIQNNDNCNAGLTGFDIDWLRVDLPQVLTLTTISVISAIIASKLYRQFGWSVYKRIGGDLRIQRIYRIIVALKITDFSGGKVVDVVLIAYHGFATLLALILQILAYSSIKRESTAGMIAFSVLWTLIVADYGLLIYAFVRLLILGSYFMIIFTSVFVVIALVTFVFSIIVTVNFGRGLKELIENYKYRLRPRPTTIDIPTLNVPPGTSSSSVYSPASLMSQQHPPTSPLSLSDSISNLSDEQKKNQQQKDDDRWTIDD
ncbi:19746_t:CDS:10 [Rhizophagus irregularis]|nr:19746_t:CDS:10 [Rhizophagus irregularis]